MVVLEAKNKKNHKSVKNTPEGVIRYPDPFLIYTHHDKVGARNPYEFANKIRIKQHKDPIIWKKYKECWDEYLKEKDPQEKKRIKKEIRTNIIKDFSTVFKKTDGNYFAFHELFDPTLHSPIYIGVRYRNLNYIKKKTSKANQVKKGSETHVGDYQACTEALAGYGTYAPQGLLPGVNPAWGIKPQDPAQGCGTTTAQEFEDVVQGCIPNCWFLAALAAVAWTDPPRLPSQSMAQAPPQGTPPDATNAFSFTFYNGATGSPKYTYDDLPLLENGGALAFAKPNPIRDLGEYWMAIYEKAYGKFIGLNSLDSNADHPDLSTFPSGDPLLAVNNITGYNTERRYSCSQFTTAVTLFNTIYQGNSSGYIKQQPNGPMSWRTRYPAVAWTHLTAPAGVTYSSDAIVANHAYSLLGLFVKDVNNRYVILRNPFGPCWFGDPELPNPNDLASGIYSVGVNTQCSNTAPFSKNLETSIFDDGIFGLKIEVFKTHFNKFGWMQP